jgi:LacI family transcriptional regulator
MPARRAVAIIVETSGSYGREILGGVARYLRTHGRNWSIFVDERELSAEAPAWLSRWRGDGIICRPMTPALAGHFRRRGIPTLDLNDQHEALGLPHIWSNMRAIGRRAAEHLLERGFQNFAFCGFRDELWSEQRRQGFSDAVSRPGLRCEAYVSPWRGRRAREWQTEHAALERWLRGLPRPLAVMACNDLRAQHVLDAARSLGLAVPEELAVIGVDDDYPFCDLCDPPLSSVVPNAQRIGYQAAETLDGLMSGEAPAAQEILVEPLGITTRQSTDTLAIDDPAIAAAVRLIRERACDGLHVSELVKRVAISRPVLERRFRKYLTRSPQAEIRRVQIARVKRLLVDTDLPLKSIASMAGFVHPEYLSVVFKRDTGATPGAYRRSAALPGSRLPAAAAIGLEGPLP